MFHSFCLSAGNYFLWIYIIIFNIWLLCNYFFLSSCHYERRELVGFEVELFGLLHCGSKTGPLPNFEITSTDIGQYQQIFVQGIYKVFLMFTFVNANFDEMVPA